MDSPKEIEEEQGKNETIWTKSSPNKALPFCLVSFLHRACGTTRIITFLVGFICWHPGSYHLTSLCLVTGHHMPSEWAVLNVYPHLGSLHCSPVNLDTSSAKAFLHSKTVGVLCRCIVKIWWSDVIFHLSSNFNVPEKLVAISPNGAHQKYRIFGCT